MKIAYSSLRFPPARGGVEAYVATMAAEMARRGHQVTVETSDFAQHLEGMRWRLPPTLSEPVDYEVHRSKWISLPGVTAYPFNPVTIVRLARLRSDVIHAHCFYYWSADGAAIAAAAAATPFVLSPSLPARNTAKWRAYRRLLGPVINNAHVTTVLSDFERTALANAGLRPRRIVTIPPTVTIPTGPTSWISPQGTDFHPEKHRLLLFVGRATDAKGVDTLIAAMPQIVRECPEARLCVAGPLASVDRIRYEAIAARLSVQGYVHLAGEVDTATRQSWYSHATVFAFPSRYEAFGIVAVEAMAAGLPVVVADGSALPEVVGFGERGLIHAAGDAAGLAAAVIKVLSDPELAAVLAQRGKRYVEEHHSATSHGDRLEEVYAIAVRSANDGAKRSWRSQRARVKSGDSLGTRNGSR